MEHIIPKIRGGTKELPNLIVVKRSINCLRSDMLLGEFMDKYPWVQENLLRTLKAFEGKIINGIDWVQEVKKPLFQGTGKDIFR